MSCLLGSFEFIVLCVVQSLVRLPTDAPLYEVFEVLDDSSRRMDKDQTKRVLRTGDRSRTISVLTGCLDPLRDFVYYKIV